MAKKVTTTTEFVDDLDGGKAEGSVAFALNGKNYEIDLSKKNRATFEKALKPYLDHARTVRGSRTATKPVRAGKRDDLAEVRAWANANGHTVSERGRIPASVLEAYDAK